MRKIVCVLIFLLGAFNITAQSHWSVRGQIIDSSNKKGLPYTTIGVTKSQDVKKVVARMVTDADGYFQLEIKEAGQYILSSVYMGKKEVKKEIVLDDRENKQVELGKIIMEDAPYVLSELTVIAERPLVKMDIDKLVYDVKADSESSTSNTLDILRKIPLVDVDGDDKIQLKGSSDFKVYVNGKLSNMMSGNPSQVLKSMPANVIRNIEIITDPGAKYDAEGTVGIINIVMDKQLLDGYTGAVGTGLDNLGGWEANTYFSIKSDKVIFSGNYSYDSERKPYSDFSLTRSDLTTTPPTMLFQEGRENTSESGQIIDLELSYEIDTLNLLSISFNNYTGKEKYYSELSVSSEQESHIPIYSYDRESQEKYKDRTSAFSVDYQRFLRSKDEMLTLSYRLDYSPEKSEGYTNILHPVNYKEHQQSISDDIDGNENTLQADYLNALSEKHTVEAGVKGIFRTNESRSRYSLWDSNNQTWKNISDLSEDYKHSQDIYSFYGTYKLSLPTWGFSAGLRMENTHQKAFFSEVDSSLNSNENHLIPSFKLFFPINENNDLRMGYNMRISRPGINYLNPYVDNTDPVNIHYGNPDLKTETNHQLSFNFSHFKKRLDFIVEFSYLFTNNSIERYSFIENGVTNTTYGNIGMKQNISLDSYFNWTPNRKLRLYLNGRLSYINITTSKKNNTQQESSYGTSNRISAGISYQLPKDFRISAYAGYSEPKIRFQRESSSLYYTKFSLRKYLFDRKLSISISASNPFTSRTKLWSTTGNDNFFQEEIAYRQNQIFSLKISYRFGKLSKTIKKAERSIINNDIKRDTEDDSEQDVGE